MTETLLDNSEQEEQPVNAKFEDMVGEGKRWKDQEALLKGKLESDTYVKVLEKRLDDFREMILKQKEESQAQEQLKVLIDRLESKQKLSSDETNDANDKPAIKPEEIESIFDKRFEDQIRRYEVSKRQLDNLNNVKAKLTEKFGTNYQTVIRDQIKELGITAEDLDGMAKRSPALVFRTLGLDQQRDIVDIAPPRSSNTFKPKIEAKYKPLSYYHELKKTNPQLYLDRNIALQMDRDAQALGEAFFDVD